MIGEALLRGQCKKLGELLGWSMPAEGSRLRPDDAAEIMVGLAGHRFSTVDSGAPAARSLYRPGPCGSRLIDPQLLEYLRRATFATLIGPLAVTGVRVGEAIALDRGDIDLDARQLVVRHGKLDKARQLCLHSSSVNALRRCAQLRDRLAPPAGTPAFFVSLAGTRLLYCNVQHAFHRLVGPAGLTPRSPSCGPRIHDLRH